jgi:hypothetical protein
MANVTADAVVMFPDAVCDAGLSVVAANCLADVLNPTVLGELSYCMSV